MAKKKKNASWGERIGHVVSDFADAASVAATGSQLGVLELAAEEELGAPAKSKRKKKAAVKKRKSKPAARKTAKKTAPAGKARARKKKRAARQGK